LCRLGSVAETLGDAVVDLGLRPGALSFTPDRLEPASQLGWVKYFSGHGKKGCCGRRGEKGRV
jgi:hypothetical protein